MLTCRHIMTGAMRKLGVLPIGRSATAAQAEEAMETLNSLYLELIGLGVFGKLHDVLVTDTTYAARENERVVCNNASGVTVTLPDEITSALLGAPSPGYDPFYSDYGRGPFTQTLPRPPRDGSVIWITDVLGDFDKSYIYEGDKARWSVVGDLSLSDDAPLSRRYGEALKALLAIKLAPGFNVEPNAFLVAEAARANVLLSMKGDRTRHPVGNYF